MSAMFDTDFRRRKAKLATRRRMGATRLVTVRIGGSLRVQRDRKDAPVHALGILANETDCGQRVSHAARPRHRMRKGWRLLSPNRTVTCAKCEKARS